MSGGGGVVGVTTTSEVLIRNMQEIALPQQQELICMCVNVPTLVLHCVFCYAISPDSPPYSAVPSPIKDRLPQSYKHHTQQLPAMDCPETLVSTQC